MVDGFDDPKLQVVACHLSRAPTGGMKGAAGKAENTSDYIQSADNAALLRLAGDRKTVVRMEHGNGAFPLQNTTLASVALEGPPDQEMIAAVLEAFSISSHRAVDQDAAFVDRQIADVALKALSPGNNDTTTAVMRDVRGISDDDYRADRAAGDTFNERHN